ncbi:MAG: sugar phosphate isomerase/epimerase [Planctomycetes bacterium]|nr:sugar phosphate isomerase/epimerase [Planctomycetota bacterium]
MKMKNIMQMNYWTIGGFEGTKPVEQALAEAKKMGVDGLELTFDAGCFAPGIKEERCQAIRKCARDLGMKIETLATGFYWGAALSSPKAQVRQKAIKFTKEYLQVAKWVGAKTVLVVPGAIAVAWDPSQPVVPYAEAWKNSTASLRQCLPTAKKLGVNIALENVWNMFLTDPMAMKSFVDQFKSSCLGVYFDVGNCMINGYPEHWIEILGKRIKAVHFKNFSREDCGGVLHGFGDDLAKGDVNWQAVLKALQKVKYTGPITTEMIPFCRLPNMVLPDMQLARDTAKKMKKILGR